MFTRTLAKILGVTLFCSLAMAQADDLELAFCVPIAHYPMADQERGGFDIDIAEILADDLGATATFTWTNFDEIGMRDSLHAGHCDVAIGVTEGIDNILTTVAYLNAPYAFVTRQASNIMISSLEDPQLRDLTIGTYQTGLPSIALRNRDIVKNVIEYAAILRPTGVDRDSPILDALEAGDVDVAIVYGPAAAARATASDVDLTVTALTPEVDFGPTLIPLTRILALGVREHDEALRDSLNRALARQWNSVNSILDAYEIPKFTLPRPVESNELANATKVGVMVPAGTPAALPNAVVGEDALLGASVAENIVSVNRSAGDQFLVLVAHTPSIESLERAARRLILVDGVAVLIGGYTPEAARVVARISAELNVPFFNVGSPEDSIRDTQCFPTTFHVAPSTSMMVHATLTTAASNGIKTIFAVIEDGPDAEGRLEALTSFADSVGITLVSSSLVSKNQFVFYPLLDEIEAATPDAVLLLIDSDSQEQLLSQAASPDRPIRILGISPIREQTRPYLQRFLQVAPELATQPRIVAWDPAAELQINDTFASRTGEPMEPAAWSTYAAIVVAHQAARSPHTDSEAGLRDYLIAADNTFDVSKDDPVTFRPQDHQMLQDLYVIQVNPDAIWGRTAAARIALAQVVGVVPQGESVGTFEVDSASCE